MVPTSKRTRAIETLKGSTILFMIFLQTGFSQVDSLSLYHPLHAGNEWLYRKAISNYSFMQPTVTTISFFLRTVIGDTLIDGKRYSVLREQDVKTKQSKQFFERYDSLNGTFFRKTASTDDMLDSVLCTTPNMYFNGVKMKFIKSSPDTFFGMPTTMRTTQLNVTGQTLQWTFSYGLGTTKELDASQDFFFGSSRTNLLLHATINGKEYGVKTGLIADSLSQYHPLHTGNTWTYRIYNYYDSINTVYMTRTVTGDSIIGNTLYKKMTEQWSNSTNKKVWVERFDDITGNYYRGINADDLEDSAAASVPMTIFRKRQLIGTSPIELFSTSTFMRYITESNVIASTQYFYTYVHKFGLFEERLQGYPILPYYIATLVYTKINGMEYGTNPLSVDDENQLSPTAFSLFQNYPNPFNPTTTITYSVPAVGTSNVVSLRVFDALGREVTTLVNEPKEAGRYSVQFVASHLASGLYFYQLRAGSFVDTKRMLLLK